MKPLFKQALRFGIVGVINTAVTFVAFILLHRVFRLGLDPSNAVSYVIGLTNSFIWNKLWTFKSKGFKPLELALFIAVFAPCWLAQWLVFRFFLDKGFIPEAAQAFGMVIYTGLNFLGNKFITFGKKEIAHERTEEA